MEDMIKMLLGFAIIAVVSYLFATVLYRVLNDWMEDK